MRNPSHLILVVTSQHFWLAQRCVSRYLNLEGQIGLMLWWNNWNNQLKWLFRFRVPGMCRLVSFFPPRFPKTRAVLFRAVSSTLLKSLTSPMRRQRIRITRWGIWECIGQFAGFITVFCFFCCYCCCRFPTSFGNIFDHSQFFSTHYLELEKVLVDGCMGIFHLIWKHYTPWNSKILWK